MGEPTYGLLAVSRHVLASIGWHINVHHVKLCTHMKCEVRHNWDMGMGRLWLIMGGAFMVY